MHKVVHGLVAINKADHIEENKSKARKNNPQTLKVYSPVTEIFKQSFFPRTIPTWNKLNGDIVNEKHAAFKVGRTKL